MKHFPANSGVQLISFPLDGTRVDSLVLPNGRIQGVSFVTAATTGSPTSVTITLADNASTPYTNATVITQTAKAITEATMPTAGWGIDADTERVITVTTAFVGGSSPTWKGTLLVQFSPGNA